MKSVVEEESMKNNQRYLRVWGARVHNLKNVDVTIPRDSITVITGLSGSGKSSLAFDTIYAEGQRRYIETLSAYARNFMGEMARPDVDKITGLSPVISIEQKTTNRNPRSTVGTQTEIYDYLRLLFARAGEAYSYVTGEKMVRYTDEQIIARLRQDNLNRRVYILAPLVHNRKGHYRELFESVRRRGYLNVRVDGNVMELVPGMKVDRYKNHDIQVVVDRLRVTDDGDDKRLLQSLDTAMRLGEGVVMIYDVDTDEVRHYSRRLMCPTSGISYPNPAPHDFSFNSPQGACPHCKGLGYVAVLDIEKIIPDSSLSIRAGGLAPVGKSRNTMFFWQIQALLDRYGCTLDTPLRDVPQEAVDEIVYGCSERLRIPSSICGSTNDAYVYFEGIRKFIENLQDADAGNAAQRWTEQFSCVAECPECHGARLNRRALHYRIASCNIAELCAMDLRELLAWFRELPSHLSSYQEKIAPEIVKEITFRLTFLVDVGLEYLSLSRPSASLSGGESQRIRLATQMGSSLVNVLYILDEPSIGLHQRDNLRLISSLRKLCDMGNTVIVVEHDQEMMEAADYIVDVGPAAGRKGGQVVYQGTYSEMLKQSTLTARYLSGDMCIAVPEQRREGNGSCFSLFGASGNNLRHVDVTFPLGTLICVTGVSGSGKSTLVNDTLQPLLSQHFYRSLRAPLPYDSCQGLEYLDKVISVDQTPLGRTPRSNPATYTGVFNDIRNFFAQLPEAQIRGYKPGRFSFNVNGGRCSVCGGNGYRTIEMNFLPDVLVPCPECMGRRYNRETLEVRYRGKSISDVLDMTVNQAVEFFQNHPSIRAKISVLQEVGLGYLRLGQPATTLSGGESQRVKLAAELARKDTGRTLYILDEPTTGLHFEDVRVLLLALNRLVDKGNTVIVIEHNLDVVKSADWIIELGPDGGRGGGQLLFAGTPEQMAKTGTGPTAPFLAKML